MDERFSNYILGPAPDFEEIEKEEMGTTHTLIWQLTSLLGWLLQCLRFPRTDPWNT